MSSRFGAKAQNKAENMISTICSSFSHLNCKTPSIVLQFGYFVNLANRLFCTGRSIFTYNQCS